MKVKGFTSESSKSGLDVSALAAAAGTSYEMARRYCEGTALPRPDTMEAIARWLDLPVSALAFGEEKSHAPIDEGTLQLCIEVVIEAQARTGTQLNPKSVAQMAAILYDEIRGGKAPSDDAVDMLIRAFRR